MTRGGHSSKQTPKTRINGEIIATQVRVISDTNEQLGILSINEARQQASDSDLDLVEVAPQAAPPVCRIMDYGQYKYKESKRLHEVKKNQKVIQVKEIKLRPKTEEHDFNFKLKHALQFIDQGNKVKVSVFFRGREMIHQELGHRLLGKFIMQTAEKSIVEVQPKMEGRSLSMILAPQKN